MVEQTKTPPDKSQLGPLLVMTHEEASSELLAATCWVARVLAVDLFHHSPSAEVPVPNSLCNSLLQTEKLKSEDASRQSKQRTRPHQSLLQYGSLVE